MPRNWLKPVQKERERVVTAALQEQSRALVKRPQRVPELEPLVGGDRDLFLGGRLHFAAEPSELVETRREIQGVTGGERVADRAGELAHLAIHLHGLIRVAEVP